MLLSSSSNINIITCENATKCEVFAAKELSKYLNLIFSVSCTFSKTHKNGQINIYIGALSHLELNKNFDGTEGFCIQVETNAIFIIGSNDNDGYNRGTLYGVYEFLERSLGCCFGAFSKKDALAGEILPRYNEFDIPNYTYFKSKADLPYRTAIVQYDAWVGNADHSLNMQFLDWLAKNRYNRILTWVGVYNQFCKLGLIKELENRGVRLTVGHHQAYATWLPPYGNELTNTQYAIEHPEFYRLEENGTRFTPKNPDDYTGQLILCNRNTLLIEEISKNIVSWVKKNPIVDTIALWPNDATDKQCCCDECKKYTKTENYLYFENEVAKRVRANVPNIKIDVLIYNDLWQNPNNIELCDGIVIDNSTWAYPNLRPCGKPDGSCLIETNYQNNLLSYKNSAKNLVFYEYYMGNYKNLQRVMPAADEMQSIFKNCMEVGIMGSGTQIECFNLWNNLLNFYCFARTAYDTSLTFEANINNISTLFGKGKDYIKEIFKIYENTLDGQVSMFNCGDFFVENIDIEKIYSLFEKAIESAEEGIHKNNIRLLRMAFRYTVLITKEPINDELKYMYTHFNSYLDNRDGYGIAIANQTITDIVINDEWYLFD